MFQKNFLTFFVQAKQNSFRGPEILNVVSLQISVQLVLRLLFIGTGFAGTSTKRLNYPTALGFDRYYNIYVTDSMNNRVQRFDLLHNGC